MGKQSKYNGENRFNNKNGNRTRLPNEFFYDKINLGNYGFGGSNDELEIYATFEYGLSVSDITELIECKKPDLLCKMLSLREAFPEKVFEPRNLIFDKSYVSDNELDKIIKWCKNNGFPFKPQIPEKKKVNAKLFTPRQKPRIHFNVWDFLKRLNDVYSLYLLYKVITDEELTSFETTAYISCQQGENGTALIGEQFKPLKEMSKDDCWSVFKSKYKEIGFTNQISFEGKIHLTVKTENLFDAAFYQLALLLNGDSIQIGKCPICHNYFERDHGSQKYCLNKNEYGRPTCYPQKTYKRKKLEQQKKNGQAF